MPYHLPRAEDKPRYVRERFDAIAHRYDLFNDLITQGQHRWWKRVLVRRADLREAERVLDLCCGTGDIALRCAQALPPGGRVYALDFSRNMLRIARSRKRRRGADMVYLGADALRLPFGDSRFDAVTVGYGLRNVVDLEACLDEVRRVLRPGGVLASLDVGKVRSAWLRPLVAFYFFRVVPWIGRLLQPGEEMYTYLPHSAVDYPHQERLRAILGDRGFTGVELVEFLGGASVIHVARKPART